mgnify:CR=1 FL=1
MSLEKISDSKPKSITLEDSINRQNSYVDQLTSENEKMRLHIKDVEAELAHAKMLLDRLDIANIVKPISDEEEIASIQLQKIKLLSRERALSLEEIKMYDLLVKNLKLAKGEVTDIQGHKSLSKTSKPDLIRLAATKK